MLLAIDVGNTQTLAGVYSGDELLHEWRMATEREATADELAADHDQILRLRGGSLGALDDMVVGSVVPDPVGGLPLAGAQVPRPRGARPRPRRAHGPVDRHRQPP